MAVLLDIDGTLLNTQEKKLNAYQTMILELKNEFSIIDFGIDLFWSIVRIQFELFKDYRKNDLEIRLRMIRAFFELDQERFENLMPQLIDIYWNTLKQGKEYPLAKEFLRELSKSNVKFYLFSDSSIEETKFKMKLFSKDFFPGGKPIIFLTDHRESSDSHIISLGRNKIPETYQYLKKKYNAKIMIGDSELFDINPAIDAGLEAFHIKNGLFDDLIERIIEVLK